MILEPRTLCDPVIPLLGVYPREMKTDVHTDVYVNVHRSTVHNGQKWKRPERPAAEERTKCVCPHKGLFSGHKKESSTDVLQSGWSLENVTLSVRRQSRRTPCGATSFLGDVGVGTARGGRQMGGFQGWGQGKRTAAAHGGGVSLGR